MIDNVFVPIPTLLFGELNTLSIIRTRPSFYKLARDVDDQRKVLWNCEHEILSIDLKYFSSSLLFSIA